MRVWPALREMLFRERDWELVVQWGQGDKGMRRASFGFRWRSDCSTLRWLPPLNRKLTRGTEPKGLGTVHLLV